MPWYGYSALMFLSSNIYYFFVKKSQAAGSSRYQYMIINHLIPLFLFLAMAIANGQNLNIGYKNISLIFVAANLFGFLGAILGYVAIQQAPNAGYSLVVQKGYAVYTSVLAVFLFSSELPLYKFGAILLILAFGAMISIDKPKQGASRKDTYPF